MGHEETAEKIMTRYYWMLHSGRCAQLGCVLNHLAFPKVPFPTLPLIEVPFKCNGMDLISPPECTGTFLCITLIAYMT